MESKAMMIQCIESNKKRTLTKIIQKSLEHYLAMEGKHEKSQ